MFAEISGEICLFFLDFFMTGYLRASQLLLICVCKFMAS